LILTPEQKDAIVAGTKLGTVWAAVGITSWGDLAAALAALYSFLLVCEFAWKKVIRPVCEWMEWVAPKEIK
jgi:hypothetical protein